MKFYVGLHQPSDAQHFDRCMVSVNRLRNRKSGFKAPQILGAGSTPKRAFEDAQKKVNALGAGCQSVAQDQGMKDTRKEP